MAKVGGLFADQAITFERKAHRYDEKHIPYAAMQYPKFDVGVCRMQQRGLY